MLAEFSVIPLQTDDLSRDVARVIDVLERCEVDFHAGPMNTALQGNWDQALGAIQRCHQAVSEHHNRVITTIIIDDRIDQPHNLTEMISAVEQRLGHKVKR